MNVLSFVTVTLYGTIIMLLFTKERKSVYQLLGIGAVCLFGGLLNLFLHQRFDDNIIYMLYPLTVHIPLLIYFTVVIKTPFCQTIFALTSAYMLTTPRKWLCIFVEYLLGGSIAANYFSKVFVSVALLVLIYKFVAPIIIKIFNSGQKETNYLCLLPLAWYIITYTTTVYSDILFSHPMITIPALTTLLSVFFIGFEICFFDYVNVKTSARHRKELFDLQLSSAEKLASHINSGESYFCENKTINAFLCMYKSAAELRNILFLCNCNLPSDIRAPDILVIITCMLDDAMTQSKELIKFEAVQRKGQICIMSETDGEGIYNQTMMTTLNSIVEHYKGIIFTDKNNYKIQISIKKGEM